MKKIILITVPLAALAACGGGGGTENKASGKAESLKAGQYEVTTEVTAFRGADEGRPKINTPQGTRTTRSVCVNDVASLPADLFADDGFTCNNSSQGFARGGTLSANLSCRRAGLSGAIGVTITGTFQAESFEAQRELVTSLSTDGDVVINSRLQGRRTGDCTAAPAAEKGKGK